MPEQNGEVFRFVIGFLIASLGVWKWKAGRAYRMARAKFAANLQNEAYRTVMGGWYLTRVTYSSGHFGQGLEMHLEWSRNRCLTRDIFFTEEHPDFEYISRLPSKVYIEFICTPRPCYRSWVLRQSSFLTIDRRKVLRSSGLPP